MKMNLKHTIIAVLAAAAFIPVTAQEQVKAEIRKGNAYQPETYSMMLSLPVSNRHNTYKLFLGSKKPIEEKPPRTVFSVDNEKRASFTSLVTWLKIKVNGIDFSRLPIQKENVNLWQDGEKKGFEFALNFDGAKMLLRLYMRPDSGVLWGELQPAQDTLEPVKTASISFACLPSLLAMKDKKVLFHNVYNHEAKSPAKIYKQHPQGQTITAADKYFIFYDTQFDGSSDDKGIGPCMVIADTDIMQSGKLHQPNAWVVTVDYTLKPDFKTFRFGIWQKNSRISNADFFKMLETEKTAFSL